MAASTASEPDTISTSASERKLTPSTEDEESQTGVYSNTSLGSSSLKSKQSLTSVTNPPEEERDDLDKDDNVDKIKAPVPLSESTNAPEPEPEAQPESEAQPAIKPAVRDGVDSLGRSYNYDYIQMWATDNKNRGSYPTEDEVRERQDEAPSDIRNVFKYATMVEDRILYLERELQRLNDRLQSKPEEPVSVEENKFDMMPMDGGDIAPVKSLNKESGSDEEKTQPLFPYIGDGLEVICKTVGRLKFIAHLTKEEEISTVLVACAQDDETLVNEKSSPKSIEAKPGQRISRLCINSETIWKFFDKKIPASAARAKKEIVILPPFKLLCTYEDDIRQHLTSCIQKLARNEASETKADPQPGSQNSSDKNSNDKDGVAEVGNDDYLSQLSGKELEVNVSHFQCLVDLMNGSLKRDLDLHHRYRHGSDGGTIEFDNLWHLFAPGDLVYTDDDTKQACRVVYISGGRPVYDPATEDATTLADPCQPPAFRLSPGNRAGSLFLTCIYINYDGKEFGPVERSFEIPFFGGVKEISLLPVHPMKYAKDVKDSSGYISRHEYQIKRGEKFHRLTEESYAHREYKGKTLVDRNMHRGVVLDTSKETRAGFFDIVDSSRSREQVDSQIIIDFEHAFLQNKRMPTLGLPTPPTLDPRELPQDIHRVLCSCGDKDCTLGKETVDMLHYDERKLDQWNSEEFLRQEQAKLQYKVEGSQLTDDHRVLLPNLVYGYVLRNLDVYPLDIELVEDFKSEKRTSFEELVLTKQNRRMVESLVSSHANSSLADPEMPVPTCDRVDLVRGKGQGLIILLHGVPGTGKSSTAECVAEYTHRPLFPITCGNIGVTPEQVQKNLEAMFYLAHKWNCVMLLDEADVFLRARDAQDMQRNAIVSVFLRALEYYAGILFLTTNKVGKIDEAFKSRIHVSLYYKKLSKHATKKVWEVNLKRTRKLKPHIEFDEAEILKFAGRHWEDNKDLPWNGRQIRNAFQSATALAEFEAAQKKEENKGYTVHENGYIHAEMKKSHFKEIAALSAAFDEYLKETLGCDDFDKAARNFDRNDRPQASALSAAPWQMYPVPGMPAPQAVASNAADTVTETTRSRKSDKSKSKKDRVETPVVERRRKDDDSGDDDDGSSSSSEEEKKSKKRSKKSKKPKSESESDSESSS